MKATVLYRIAAALFIAFAIGHTFGFLTFRPSSPEGLAVLESMRRVHFDAGGRSYSYGGWYRGFGLSISATTFFWAYLSWRLGEMARTIPHAVGALGWAFFAVQMVGVVLAFVYFGPPPMLLSILVTGLVGTAAWFTTH